MPNNTSHKSLKLRHQTDGDCVVKLNKAVYLMTNIMSKHCCGKEQQSKARHTKIIINLLLSCCIPLNSNRQVLIA